MGVRHFPAKTDQSLPAQAAGAPELSGTRKRCPFWGRMPPPKQSLQPLKRHKKDKSNGRLQKTEPPTLCLSLLYRRPKEFPGRNLSPNKTIQVDLHIRGAGKAGHRVSRALQGKLTCTNPSPKVTPVTVRVCVPSAEIHTLYFHGDLRRQDEK